MEPVAGGCEWSKRADRRRAIGNRNVAGHLWRVRRKRNRRCVISR
jgi:hypothetical protein